MNAEVAAWVTVRVMVERLRTAALDALDAFSAAEAAGIPGDRMLTALRIEHDDWHKKLVEMQRADDLLGAIGARTRLDMIMLIDDPIATEDEVISLERSQGFLAYHIGKAIRECPYPPSSGSYITWRNGWMEAKHGPDA